MGVEEILHRLEAEVSECHFEEVVTNKRNGAGGGVNFHFIPLCNICYLKYVHGLLLLILKTLFIKNLKNI